MNGFITRSMPPVRLPARIFSVISKGFIILSGCIHPWAIYLPMSLKQIISNLLNCVSIFWGEVHFEGFCQGFPHTESIFLRTQGNKYRIAGGAFHQSSQCTSLVFP